MMIRRFAPLVLIAGLGACASHSPQPAPFSQAALPEAVKVPTGHAVSMETAAAGNITYQCRAKKDMAGQFEWVFVGPEAPMVDRSGKSVGKYYGPPATWESNDGSKVSGAQVAVAPNGTGNIPLQLVKANPATGMGAMQGVTYIQRVATEGGVAPALPCGQPTECQKQVVTYRADYIFWRAM
ncbi:MAG: DUF3455 domain-containing protein [Rhodoferax sp.]|nr:DUF3455 domain-containing protein [Rhodoferax sp.]